MANGIGRVGWRNFVSTPTTSSIITTGLVLNLDAGNALSYSGTGTTWTDLSGNGNNATLINGTSYSSTNGGTMVFDGINDYVDTNLITNQSAFSYGIWGKANSGGFNRRIMGNADSLGGAHGVDIIWGALGANTIYSVRRGAGNLDIFTSNIANFSGNWHYIVLTYDSVNGSKLYCDNVLVASNATPGFVSSLNLRIGRDGNGTDAFLGSVGAVQVYNRALTSTEVTNNFDATKSRFGFTSYTTRTAAFATATGITDTTILNALNTFDTGLISNGLDTKMKALYPFVGGTASTHKYNFMDARDVDAAFRLQFNGGWVHSSTGAKPNGTNAYANTNFNPSVSLTSILNVHVSIYSRTEIRGGVDAGMNIVINNQINNELTILSSFSGSTYAFSNITGANSGAAVNSTFNSATGHFIANRESASSNKIIRNGTVLATNTTSITGIAPTGNLFLTAQNYFNNSNYQVLYYTTREQAFTTIGESLTNAQAITFYNLVQTLQTALSRAV
jgi:hypothetical protein